MVGFVLKSKIRFDWQRADRVESTEPRLKPQAQPGADGAPPPSAILY